MRASKAQVDVMAAVHVGKHSKDKVEMCESSPNIVAATANARATIWRIRV